MSNKEFKRVLNFRGVMLLMIGGIISTWLYLLPGVVGALAGPSSILAWFIGAVLMVCIGLCCAELASAFPKAGGLAVYPYETLGRRKSIRSFFSCLAGVGVFLGNVFFVAITAIMMTQYFCVLVSAAAPYAGIIGLSFVILAYVINVEGISITANINRGMLIMLIIILGVAIISFFTKMQPTNFRPFFLHGTRGFLACLPIAVTSFGAWVTVCCIAEEIKEPEKTIPKAIFATIFSALVIQIILTVAIYGVINPAEFVKGSPEMAAPLGYAAQKLGYKWLIWAIPISGLLAGFTSILVGMLGASRALVALGRNEVFPKAFGFISKRGTPWVSLTFVAIVGAVFAYFPKSLFSIIVVGTLIGTALPFGINIVSFIGLRYFRKDVKPPFRAPGGYVLPVVAFIALGIGCVGLGLIELKSSMVALAILLGYFIIRCITHPSILR